MEDSFTMSARCIMPRPQVLALVREATTFPLAVVAATAGYGKTTALRSHVETLQAHAWVSLTGGDANVFWKKFCAAVQALSARSGEKLEELGLPTDERLAAWAVDALLTCARECRTSTRTPAALVIDDFHLMGQAPFLCRMFRDFAFEEPEGLSIVLLTRTEPELPLATLLSKDLCRVIRTPDLALQAHEVQEYCAMRGIALNAQESLALWKRTGGWIALLSAAGGDLCALEKQGDIFGLLRENLFHALSPAEQDMLCRLSTLDSFTPAQAANLLACPARGPCWKTWCATTHSSAPARKATAFSIRF